MAKADNASSFERHLEKVVLLVSLALLGMAVYYWVLSSPVSLSVVDEQGKGLRKGITPENVDKTLARAAANIQRTYDRVEVPVKPVYSWANDMLEFRQLVPPQAHLIDPALPGKAIKSVEPVTAKGITLAELEAVLAAPPAPQVGAWIIVPRKAKGDLAETVVAHGVLSYPMAAVQAKWAEMLKGKALFEKPIVQKVIVQVQQQLADGQWGPWKDANCAVPLAAGPEGKPLALPTIRDYDGKNIEEVRKDRTALGVETAQDQVLRPGYYSVWSGPDGWADWRTQAPPAPKLQTGDVAVWFHDDAGLASGGVYRFRAQLAFVNPILTYPQMGVATGEAEAKVPYINSKPGEPSEPAGVSRPVRFYLSGAAAAIGKMTVTVYARTWGQWVRATFQVKSGEMIGGRAKVSIRDPMSEKGDRKVVEVDFTTGAVAIRMDFAKTLQVQNIKVRTAELLYLDKDGKVKSRIQSLDDRDESRKRLEDESKLTVGKE